MFFPYKRYNKLKKALAYLFILVLVTTTVTQAFHNYNNENIVALSDICQVEEQSNAEFIDVQRMSVTFSGSENSYAFLLQKLIALPVCFPSDQYSTLRIDFPPELA